MNTELHIPTPRELFDAHHSPKQVKQLRTIENARKNLENREEAVRLGLDPNLPNLSKRLYNRKRRVAKDAASNNKEN